MGRKIFFWPISGTEFDYFWSRLGKNKFPGAFQLLKYTFVQKYRIAPANSPCRGLRDDPGAVLKKLSCNYARDHFGRKISRPFSEQEKGCYTEKDYHACTRLRIKSKFLVHERVEKNYSYTKSRPSFPSLRSQMVHPLVLIFFSEICELRY